MKANILELLDGKWEDGTRPKDLFALHVSNKPAAHLGAIIEGLGSEKRKVQSGCSELASLLSEERPELLLPHIELFVEGLDSKAKVRRWESVCTLGNLSVVDDEGRVVEQIPKMVPLLRDKSIVLANHTVWALAKIGKANPERAEELFKKLVAAKNNFEKNKIGFIIEASELLAVDEKMAAKVRRFVSPYQKSDVNVVARKAKGVLKRLDG